MTDAATTPSAGRSTRAALVASGLGLLVGAGTLLGAGPPAAAADPGPVSGRATCSLTGRHWTAHARVDSARTERFAAYGNSGVGWTGGDSTYSVRLTGNRTVWLFSDTFWGPVNSDLSRPTTVPFLNNSFVVERGGYLRTVAGGNPQEPDSLVPPDEPGTWNWLGAGQATPASLDVMFLEFARTGSGPLDFAWRENKLGRFHPDTLRLREVVPLPSAAGVQWASWLLRSDGFTYVYGVADLGLTKYMHLARVPGTDLATGGWEYWTGSSWSPTETDSARLMSGVANEYSVSRWRDGYLLVTQDTRELFSSRILAYVGCSPTGPFTEAATLYTTPETGASGSYADPDIFTYNAHEHPDLRRGDRLLVTYNVNSLDPNADLYDDVTIYRPRFVEVTLVPDRRG
ncbi:DUF4185 domain-containing protein [Actinopolymorpha sp. NPDC004070]|uniref:DUF4185 domain-containing protein n=1 Tax=Actinopolymorpha sp. NPDC004070 TaxID=3154548 RepID=UPI0033A344F1